METCNEKNCTCPEINCERHGKCCQCVNYHREVGSLTMCMRDLEKKNQ